MTNPLTWVKRMKEELPELNEVPLFGNAPPFDWVHFSSALSSSLSSGKWVIEPREPSLREGADIREGMGTDLLILPVAINPIGTAFWIMPKEGVHKLTSWLLKPGSRAKGVSSESLQEGFYRFLILEALSVLQKQGPFRELTLQLSEEETDVARALCIDIKISLEEKSVWGRLAIPEELKDHWIQLFSEMQEESISQELAKRTALHLTLKTGSVQITQEEFDELKVGDFLSLDQGSFDPVKRTGLALLMLKSMPVFTLKIKPDAITIADHAFSHEETNPDLSVLTLSAEIGFLDMSLDQMMHLRPNQTLELPIHPTQDVTLTLKGEKVASGELLYLGEMLGVRITEK